MATARPSARQAFTSFGHRNYRLWFTGQASSLVGTWMQMTAQGFLMYQLTKSPVYLGLIGFAAGAPTWLFSLFGGVVSDRVSRRSLLIVTQMVMMALAFILSGLTFFGLVQPWQIVVLSFCTGIANAFDGPARQSFVVELVGHDDLSNAIALNSMMFNLGTAIGPAVAGVVYAAFGPAMCFFINGVSFIAVIIALWMMKLAPFVRRPRTTSALQDIKEGFAWVIGQPVIRTLILGAMAINLFSGSFGTLMPAWAVKVLGGDSTTNGFMQSARGIGTLCSAMIIASLGRINFKGKLLTFGMFAFPTALLLWSFVRTVLPSMVALAAVGFSMMFMMNMANVLVQTHVPDQMRGRVMSIYSLCFFGMMPIGSLMAGTVANVVGEPRTIGMFAVASLSVSILLFIFAPGLRRLE